MRTYGTSKLWNLMLGLEMNDRCAWDAARVLASRVRACVASGRAACACVCALPAQWVCKGGAQC
jgi:hypothetical protein